MNYLCPKCHRVIYNRRLHYCGFCGAVIPNELRFSAEEIAELDRKMSLMEEQTEERERIREAKEEVRKRHSADGTTWGFF